MFPGLSGLRVTCDHVATETQISRIQCPHLLLRTYVLFPVKSLTRFSLSFQGRISCVCSRVLPTCSTLPSFCCWCCSLHRLMNSVPWAKPPPVAPNPDSQPPNRLHSSQSSWHWSCTLWSSQDRDKGLLSSEPTTWWRRAGNQNRKHSKRPGSHHDSI